MPEFITITAAILIAVGLYYTLYRLKVGMRVPLFIMGLCTIWTIVFCIAATTQLGTYIPKVFFWPTLLIPYAILATATYIVIMSLVKKLRGYSGKKRNM